MTANTVKAIELKLLVRLLFEYFVEMGVTVKILTILF